MGVPKGQEHPKKLTMATMLGRRRGSCGSVATKVQPGRGWGGQWS